MAYCFIGAIGGAELATALPTLIREYATATPSHRMSLETVFTGYTDGIYRGLWNLLEEFLAGIGGSASASSCGPSGVGSALATIVLGVACLVDSLGTAINVDAVSLGRADRLSRPGTASGPSGSVSVF